MVNFFTFSSCLRSSQIGMAAPSVCCGWLTKMTNETTKIKGRKLQQKKRGDIFVYFRLFFYLKIERNQNWDDLTREWTRNGCDGSRWFCLDVGWTLVGQLMIRLVRYALLLMWEEPGGTVVVPNVFSCWWWKEEKEDEEDEEEMEECTKTPPARTFVHPTHSNLF